MSPEILAALIIGLLGFGATLYTQLLQKEKKRKSEEEQRALEADFKDLRNILVHQIPVWGLPAQGILDDILMHAIESAAEKTPRLSRDDIEKLMEEQTALLKERIERIEERIPPEAELEKIASINDAIFATRIEGLEDSLKKIEKKILSHWDVAKIVFAIIGTLGLLVGLALTIIKP